MVNLGIVGLGVGAVKIHLVNLQRTIILAQTISEWIQCYQRSLLVLKFLKSAVIR